MVKAKTIGKEMLEPDGDGKLMKDLRFHSPRTATIHVPLISAEGKKCVKTCGETSMV
jgi:hypothetical protein